MVQSTYCAPVQHAQSCLLEVYVLCKAERECTFSADLGRGHLDALERLDWVHEEAGDERHWH